MHIVSTASYTGSVDAKNRMSTVIAVIFEVWPSAAGKQEYIDLAAHLRPLLDQVDGFISIERFESLHEPGKLLSLSFWRDEQAIEAWRRLEEHRQAQVRGRTSLFRDYRLRIAEVGRDYGMMNRDQAPPDSREVHG
jgi:heme-degrading monooxygenase HmoA